MKKNLKKVLLGATVFVAIFSSVVAVREYLNVNENQPKNEETRESNIFVWEDSEGKMNLTVYKEKVFTFNWFDYSGEERSGSATFKVPQKTYELGMTREEFEKLKPFSMVSINRNTNVQIFDSEQVFQTDIPTTEWTNVLD